MLKTLSLAICSAVVVTAIAATPADAYVGHNGNSLQGTSFNGNWSNGTTLQGITRNGSSIQGVSYNGAPGNGANLQSITRNGASAQGVSYNGGEAPMNGQVTGIELPAVDGNAQ